MLWLLTEPGYIQVLAASASTSMQHSPSSPTKLLLSLSSVSQFSNGGTAPAGLMKLSRVDCLESLGLLLSEHEIEGFVVWQATSISLKAASQSNSWREMKDGFKNFKKIKKLKKEENEMN